MSNEITDIPGINMHSRLIPGTEFIVTAKNRFYSRTLLPNELGCMEWLGSTKKKAPYGNFRHRGKLILTHRYSYQLHCDKIPTGMLVLHTCDNPRCVAPDHLLLGTYKDNAADTTARKRWGDRRGSNSYRCKLSPIEVFKIIQLLNKGVDQISIGKKFNVHQATISRIKLGKRKAI